jgi:type I restriction enzyme, S subunit
VSDKSNKTLKLGWRQVKFGEVVRLSKARSQDPLADGIERYVGLEHLEPGDLRIRSWGNVADGVTFTSVFKPGQVLFGKRRAYQRKVAVADFSGVCSGDIYVLEVKDAQVLMPELLPFICQTDAFFDHAVGTSAGSLSPRTNWKSLADFQFLLPQRHEQLRISGLLGEIENNSAFLESLAAECAKLTEAVFSHHTWNDESLTQIPISQIAEINPKVSSLDADDPFIPMEAVDPWTQQIDPSRIEKKGDRGGVKAQGGDILMARITPCLENGKIAQVPLSIKKCGGSTEFIVFRAKNGTDQQFLYHLITSRFFHSQAAGVMSGSTGRQRASANDVGRIVVPELPLTKQTEVCDRIKQISEIKEATNSRLLRLSQMKLAVLMGAESE